MKKLYIILHSITFIGLLMTVFAINLLFRRIENQPGLLSNSLFLYGLISTFTSIVIFFPLDIFLLSRKIKPFLKIKRNWIYSIIAYLITFGLADLHMGIITPGKKDFFDFVLNHVFNHFDSVFAVYAVYLIFFLAILLGIDILLRYIANKYLSHKQQ